MTRTRAMPAPGQAGAVPELGPLAQAAGAPPPDDRDAPGGRDAAVAPARAAERAWADALLAARLLAIDPTGLCGAVCRARPGPVRDRWLGFLTAAMAERPVLRLPPGADEGALAGGLDLAATLAAGRVVRSAGLLERAGDRLMLLPMAERAAAGLAARLGARLDRGGACLVALDEGAEPDEAVPEALADRLAFRVALDGVPLAAASSPAADPTAIAAGRARLGQTVLADGLIEALGGAAAALGIDSARATLLALRTARAAAALEGAAVAGEAAARLAARLVLAPRARSLPELPPDAAEDDPPPATDPSPADGAEEAGRERPAGEIPAELLVEAARAALPPDLLARLAAGKPLPRRAAAGAAEAAAPGTGRGRPAGSRPGTPEAGRRLDLIATLRAAAPWQPLRRRIAGGDPGRLRIRASDFRIRRTRPRQARLVIFVVDASGSMALTRLAEAKGAVELMLGQSYARRDQVALLAFRGQGAAVLLPPTRSLVQTKRRLGALPGGGPTPLAAGLAAALELAQQARGRGLSPQLAILTDGRANLARDGTADRAQAGAEATAVAAMIRSAALPALLVDTGTRPGPAARALAETMAARYLALPRLEARALSAAVAAALPEGG